MGFGGPSGAWAGATGRKKKPDVSSIPPPSHAGPTSGGKDFNVIPGYVPRTPTYVPPGDVTSYQGPITHGGGGGGGQAHHQQLLNAALSFLSAGQKAVLPFDIKASEQYGIPISALLAQQDQESGYDPEAESGAGAFGISQFIPETADSYGVQRVTPNMSPEERKQAIESQVMGEAHLLSDEHFNQDPHGALEGYSGGYSPEEYDNPILEAAERLRQEGVDKLAKGGAAGGGKATIAGTDRFAYPTPGWQNSRTDMGKDYAYTHEGQPIRALGAGEIVQTSPGEEHWEGGNGFLLKLDNAKGLPSPYVYYYEGINPTVKPGDRVHRGQTVGTGGITGSIEMGYANEAGEPLSASEHSEGADAATKYGVAMSRLLTQIHKGKTQIPLSLIQPPGGDPAASSGFSTPSSGSFPSYSPLSTPTSTAGTSGIPGTSPSSSSSPYSPSGGVNSALSFLGSATPDVSNPEKTILDNEEENPIQLALKRKFGI